MKLLIGVLVSVLMMGAAGAQAKKEETRNAPAKSADAPKEIPAGSVLKDDGFYHYTDSQGKKWIYRKTPFGTAHYLEKEEAEIPKPVENYSDVKAAEYGDSIRFERPGPFGVYKWQRKKTELNEMEQAVWNREKSRTAAKQD